MFCPNCGTQNTDQAAFCANCGQALNQASTPPPPPPPVQPAGPVQPNLPPAPGPAYSQRPVPRPVDDPGVSTLFGILAFCVPIAGLILYFVWREEKPKTARQICTISAISFGLAVVFYILMFVVALSTQGSYDY